MKTRDRQQMRQAGIGQVVQNPRRNGTAIPGHQHGGDGARGSGQSRAHPGQYFRSPGRDPDTPVTVIARPVRQSLRGGDRIADGAEPVEEGRARENGCAPPRGVASAPGREV